MTLHEAIRRGVYANDQYQSNALDKRIAELEKELRELRKRKQLTDAAVLINGLLINEEA